MKAALLLLAFAYPLKAAAPIPLTYSTSGTAVLISTSTEFRLPRFGILLSCHENLALVVVNGKYQVLDAINMTLSATNWSDNVTYDHRAYDLAGGTRGVIIVESSGDGGRGLFFDWSSAQIGYSPFPDFPETHGGLSLQMCDLADGRRLSASSAGFEIRIASGPPVIELMRQEDKRERMAGLARSLEDLEAIRAPGSHSFRDGSMADMAAVDSLLHLAESIKEKEQLLVEVIDTAYTRAARIYAACALAEHYYLLGNAQKSSAYLQRASEFAGDWVRGSGEHAGWKLCISDLLHGRINVKKMPGRRTDLEFRRQKLCASKRYVRNFLIPELLELRVARRKWEEAAKIGRTSNESYRALLIYRAAASSALGWLRPDLLAGGAGELLPLEPGLKELSPEGLKKEIEMIDNLKSEVLRVNPSLAQVRQFGPDSLFGYNMTDAMDSLAADAFPGRRTFNSPNALPTEDCP